MSDCKILLFDIENSPSKAYIWQSKTLYVNNDMIFDEWYMLCWAAKWLGGKEIMSSALCDKPGYKKDKSNDYFIVRDLWRLMNEADVLVAHNGINFDVKKANARFIYHDMPPPSPYKVVDTLQVARNTFKFTSNRLDYLSKRLGIGKKKETTGMPLWEGCMSGDMACWKKMVEYCKNDVVLLEQLYTKMLPYIKNHPNQNVYNGTYGSCPKCGKSNLVKQGVRKTMSGDKQSYQCKDCGGWCQEGSVVKNG